MVTHCVKNGRRVSCARYLGYTTNQRRFWRSMEEKSVVTTDQPSILMIAGDKVDRVKSRYKRKTSLVKQYGLDTCITTVRVADKVMS